MSHPTTLTVTVTERPAPVGYRTWNEYWTKEHNQPWRTEPEIESDRQDFLKGRRDFKRQKLSRADVEWLLATLESGGMQGPVDWSDRKQRQRKGLDLGGADLRGAMLSGLPLAATNLEGVLGGRASEEFKTPVTLIERNRRAVHLENTDLRAANLDNASLGGAHLEGADLSNASLVHASLSSAFMSGADLFGADLRFADLREVSWDATTSLRDVTLATSPNDAASLADIRWDGVNLATLDLTYLTILGDECEIQNTPANAKKQQGQRRSRQDRMRAKQKESARKLDALREAVRAYRQLATTLRNQGVNEPAERFALRAQVLQRQVLRRERHVGRYLFSWFLAVLSGYGYRLRHILVAYAVVLAAFAALYFVVGIPNDTAPTNQQYALHALLISFTAIHGRVFFEQFGFSLQGWLAAIESVVGVVIEAVFVAMLIQRFFGR